MRERRPFATIARFLLSSAATWAALVVVVALHALFSWWFHPSIAMQGVALLADIVCLGFGVFLALGSQAFGRFVNALPSEERNAEIHRILPSCTERFRDLARQCLALIDRIGKEFKDQDYGEELGTLVSNLRRLAESNSELNRRWQAFGTPEQKRAMGQRLEAQAGSLQTMLGSLKELAGNLSLIEASSEPSTASAAGIRDINRGLEELMKEWGHDA